MANYPWDIDKRYPPRGISSNGNDIVENPDTAPVLIGHTLKWCSELESTLNEALAKAEEYFEELVKAGLRQRPKTTEDTMSELMAMMQTVIASNQALANKVEKLEGEKNELKSDIRDSKGRFKPNQPQSGAGAGQPPVDSAGDAGVR